MISTHIHNVAHCSIPCDLYLSVMATCMKMHFMTCLYLQVGLQLQVPALVVHP
jgi:hypothetical protein